jgi:hypothetical protein
MKFTNMTHDERRAMRERSYNPIEMLRTMRDTLKCAWKDGEVTLGNETMRATEAFESLTRRAFDLEVNNADNPLFPLDLVIRAIANERARDKQPEPVASQDLVTAMNEILDRQEAGKLDILATAKTRSDRAKE